MGRVDLAIRREGTFERMYAIKRLHPHLASDPEFRAMFLEEARIAGMLRHPNVVGVLDLGQDRHGPFLVMDYVDGLPLENLIRLSRTKGHPMPVQVCVRIALDVARGLHAAHELAVGGRHLGLVHRDLSPQNVLVGFDGSSRISDFGIAKALGRSTRTATGVIKGKMAYMAPEQLRREEPDRRADLFALGVVTYEMLSSEPNRVNSQERARRTLEEPPPDIGEQRADVPDELVRMLFELMAREREERPGDAREVVHRLEAIQGALLSVEPPIDVADYVAVVGGEVRREQEQVIQEALRNVRETQARRGLGRALVVAIVLLVLGALGVGAAAIGWPRHAPTAREVASRVAPTPARTTVPATAPPTAAPATATVPAPVAPSLAQPRADAPAGEPLRPPPRSRVGSRHARKGTERLPEWMEFGR